MNFINPKGYWLVKDEEKSTWWKAIYDFSLVLHAPLTFHDGSGRAITPNRHYLTDMGSIPRFPPILQAVVPKDRFLGFFHHDSGYEFGGLHVDGVFTPMTRRQIDDLLFDMILADPIPGGRAIAWTVWSQVRLFGRGNFGKRTELPPDPPRFHLPIKLA
jgi:hypothetical protein